MGNLKKIQGKGSHLNPPPNIYTMVTTLHIPQLENLWPKGMNTDNIRFPESHCITGIYFCLSLDNILQAISAAVNREEEFPPTVSVSHVVEQGLAQWKWQKKALPISQLKIKFIGEAGLDTGALQKEFLTGTHIWNKT